MSADNFTGQYISSTFQRLLQLSDNGAYVTDGTGSIISFLPLSVLTASYVSGITALSTSSLLTSASANLNTITFVKGDGSTFPVTIQTGSSSSQNINTGSFITTGSNSSTQAITGSLDITGSFGLFSYGSTPPVSTPSRVGLFYFTDTELYISLE